MMRLGILLAFLVVSVPALSQQTGHLDGRVLSGSKPLAANTVLIEGYAPGNQRGFRQEVETANDGSFTVWNLPPGRYRVSRITFYPQTTAEGTSETGTGTHGVRAEVTAGGKSSVTIGGSGRTVVGRLAPGAGLAGRRLAFTAGNYRFLTLNGPREDGFPGRHLVLTIKDDGTFRCEDVPPGEYTLFVSAKDWDARLDSRDTAQVSRVVVIPPAAAGENQPHDLGKVELQPIGNTR